jgi:hypothetical protein
MKYSDHPNTELVYSIHPKAGHGSAFGFDSCPGLGFVRLSNGKN